MKIALLLCMATISHIMANGGSVVGNGGDTIYCSRSSQNNFYGHYTLDYLLEYKSHSTPIGINEDFKTINEKIRRNLALLYPEILPHFDDFFHSLAEDETVNRKWLKSDTGLIDLEDENIIQKLPPNCLNHKKPQLIQTVIRQATKDKIIYNYNDDVLSFQKINNPLQYSFFMMHEWMWDLTQDVRIIRKLNWLLHSQQFMTYTREQLLQKFNSWQLFTLKLSYCTRSKYISNHFPKKCRRLRSRDLRSISTLTFNNLPKDFLFRIADFYGFSNVKTFELVNTKNLNHLLNPRMFSPFYRLENLILKNGHLISLSTEILRDLTSLKNLDLRGNENFVFNKECDYLDNLEVLKISSQVKINCLPLKIKRIVLDSKPTNEYIKKIQLLNNNVRVTY